MFKQSISIGLIGLTLACGSAMANVSSGTSLFSVDMQGGYSRVGNLVSAKAKSNFGFGVGAGYHYAIADNTTMGLGLSYTNWGKNKAANGNASDKLTSFNILATLQTALGNGFNVLGKAGMARVHQEVTGSSGTKGTTNKWLPLAAVGFNYAVVENVTLGAEYDHLFGKSNTAPSVDAGFVNLTYTIPMNG